MKISKKAAAAVVGAVSLALIGMSATAANAATVAPLPGSGSPIYLIDGNTGLAFADGVSIGWDDAAIAAPTTNPEDPFTTTTTDSTSIAVFLSPRGSETNISAWTAWGESGFAPGTTDLLQPQLSPGNALIAGNAAGAKAAGGDFSLGFAYVRNNGLTIAAGGVVFGHVVVTPGTGAYTFVGTTNVAGPDCTVTPLPAECPPVDPTLTGSIDLEATTIGAADGALSLTVPAGAKATLGAATLVNQLSTSTGTLPTFTVSDARVVTRPGWTLTSSVADFKAGASTIEAKNFGFAPAIFADGTTSTGVTVAAGQVAGSANNAGAAFASADAGSGLGDTKLNAALKLVAPANAAAGTYTSKMTLTLVSK